MATVGFPLRVAALAAAMALVLLTLVWAAPRAEGAPQAQEGWRSNPSFTINFLGRDGPGGSDHYQATLGWGATFFGIATDAMPLVPPGEAVAILMEGYRAEYPDRSVDRVQPGDSFEFFVPAGTLVCARWRPAGPRTTEYRSLRGDQLVVYNSFGSPLLYRLQRAEEPSRVEMAINQDVALKPLDLARVLYGRDDPSFQPDFLQMSRAMTVLRNDLQVVSVDTTRIHLDDFWDLRGSGEAGGKTEEGLDIYWYRSEGTARPLFRVDDAVGDTVDPSALRSPLRVYYYKDGVVRAYLRADDTIFLSGRQPRNDAWSKVYAQFGRVDPAPTRWEVGQPEQDAAAQEMKSLGIVVLRYEPKQAPKGNFFTQLLDMLMALMKRKET